MGKSLSDDLRVRVVEAVEAGASRRQAAARFGVSVSSAIRWARSWNTQGDVRAKPQGGDRRSARIDAHSGFLVEQIEQTPTTSSPPRKEGTKRWSQSTRAFSDQFGSYPELAKKFAHCAGGKSSMASAIAAQRSSTVRAAAFLSEVLSLAKACSIGLKSGE